MEPIGFHEEVSRQREQATGTGEKRERGAQNEAHRRGVHNTGLGGSGNKKQFFTLGKNPNCFASNIWGKKGDPEHALDLLAPSIPATCEADP